MIDQEAVPSLRRPSPVRAAAGVLATLLVVITSCSVSPATENLTVQADSEATSVPATSPQSTTAPNASDATTPPASTDASTPVPTAVNATDPLPTPTPLAPPPSPTPRVVDITPVVVQGEGWAITEQDVARLTKFVETTHQLDFNQGLGVRVSDDIGAGFAQGFEPFTEPDWRLLTALGIVAADDDRLAANQLRLDRVRGVCCDIGAITEVIIEVQPSKLATEVILVHELTHALHTQHPELFRRSEREAELPNPMTAAIEGVPQFVAFAYLATAPQDEQDLVRPELAIITDDMVLVAGAGPARFLNYAYDSGPTFVEAVVAARGLSALSELMTTPPTTNEQVLFPDRYLAGEGATLVDAPAAPAGSSVIEEGRIGAVALSFMIAASASAELAGPVVKDWAGDRYVMYRLDGRVCIRGEVLMDEEGSAELLREALDQALAEHFDAPLVTRNGERVRLQTC